MTPKLQALAAQYPVVAVTGPRQSGKTTLVKAAFPDAEHVSLEDPDTRDLARTDPRRFLRPLLGGAVIDEVQRVPELLSYLQTEVDRDERPGRFILTGSSNLLLQKQVSQTLAGRIAILTLLPLSQAEMRAAGRLPSGLEEAMLAGGYPRIHARGLDPTEWHANYTATFVERDVRRLAGIGDLDRFQRFLRMCAARSGQLLNLSGLGNDVGVTHNTARSWLSVLEAAYLVHLVRPHHANLGKRLVRTPKLHFLDTGLLCYLLGIHDAATLSVHAHRGAIFESWVCSELFKAALNRGRPPRLHFWRDHAGREVDFIVGDPPAIIPIEAKSGTTVASDFTKGLHDWWRSSGQPAAPAWVVHGGDRDADLDGARAVGWRSIDEVTGSIAW